MSFEPFASVMGAAASIPAPNIDTDVIIRVEHLTKPRSDVGPFAFEALRFLANGEANSEFSLNQPRFLGAPTLITGPNFGCGSSRESAVWAIAGLGIRCIIGTTFGDIFYANCAQNGVLVVILGPNDIADLMALSIDGDPVTVDLASQYVETVNGQRWAFSILPAAKQSLLLGLDDIELALEDHALISQWQDCDRLSRPWVWNAAGEPPENRPAA